jgi:hypothetical protein
VFMWFDGAIVMLDLSLHVRDVKACRIMMKMLLHAFHHDSWSCKQIPSYHQSQQKFSESTAHENHHGHI